jgi:hypothetical protein
MKRLDFETAQGNQWSFYQFGLGYYFGIVQVTR